MNWKFWKRKQTAAEELHVMQLAAISTASIQNTAGSIDSGRIGPDSPYYTAAYQDVCRAVDREVRLRADLSLARRRLARPKDGMNDDEVAEAFTHLLENKGFEAVLQLLTEQELAAMDAMTEDTADFGVMKQRAGEVAALSNFHHRLVTLEEQARSVAQRGKPKAA